MVAWETRSGRWQSSSFAVSAPDMDHELSLPAGAPAGEIGRTAREGLGLSVVE